MHDDMRDSGKVHFAYNSIKNLIKANHFKPGEQIHAAKIAEHLNISPTPVREALTRLQSEALVYAVANRGFFARRISVKEAHELYECAFLIFKHSMLRLVNLYRPISYQNGIKYFDEVQSSLLRFADLLGSSHSTDCVLLAKELELVYCQLAEVTANGEMTRIVLNYIERTRPLRALDLEHADVRRTLALRMRKIAQALDDSAGLDACTLLDAMLEGKLRRLPALAKDAHWQAAQGVHNAPRPPLMRANEQ